MNPLNVILKIKKNQRDLHLIFTSWEALFLFPIIIYMAKVPWVWLANNCMLVNFCAHQSWSWCFACRQAELPGKASRQCPCLLAGLQNVTIFKGENKFRYADIWYFWLFATLYAGTQLHCLTISSSAASNRQLPIEYLQTKNIQSQLDQVECGSTYNRTREAGT